MSQATRTTYDVGPFFHTVSHYNSPADVLKDARLSTDEKRVVLSSWASDMYAVDIPSGSSRSARYPAETPSGRHPGSAQALG